jgi:hypothetical protein
VGWYKVLHLISRTFINIEEPINKVNPTLTYRTVDFTPFPLISNYSSDIILIPIRFYRTFFVLIALQQAVPHGIHPLECQQKKRRNDAPRIPPFPSFTWQHRHKKTTATTSHFVPLTYICRNHFDKTSEEREKHIETERERKEEDKHLAHTHTHTEKHKHTNREEREGERGRKGQRRGPCLHLWRVSRNKKVKKERGTKATRHR